MQLFLKYYNSMAGARNASDCMILGNTFNDFAWKRITGKVSRKTDEIFGITQSFTHDLHSILSSMSSIRNLISGYSEKE